MLCCSHHLLQGRISALIGSKNVCNAHIHVRVRISKVQSAHDLDMTNETLYSCSSTTYNKSLILKLYYSNLLQYLITENRQQFMTGSTIRILLNQARPFIAGTIFVLVCLALICEPSWSSAALDNAATSSLIMSESAPDDVGRGLDSDSPFDAPIAYATLTTSDSPAPVTPTTHVISSYLIFFLGAPPRAPPSQQLV